MTWIRLTLAAVFGLLGVSALYAIALGLAYFAGGDASKIFLAIMWYVFTALIYEGSNSESEEKPA